MLRGSPNKKYVQNLRSSVTLPKWRGGEENWQQWLISRTERNKILDCQLMNIKELLLPYWNTSNKITQLFMLEVLYKLVLRQKRMMYSTPMGVGGACPTSTSSTAASCQHSAHKLQSKHRFKRAHAHVNARTRLRTHAYIHTHTHPHTQTQTHARVCAHTHTHTHTQTHTHTHLSWQSVTMQDHPTSPFHLHEINWTEEGLWPTFCNEYNLNKRLYKLRY